ncbi:Retrovirus-related Pol polyprotein LINE-1 [Senna tora]|uniref:Retrovirus-related Pol polyprotein LINE-1 n=1 Tax=Senna tora TaxID=362788 RepID=A0A835CLH8_9FABA|nr:Retrovirus-related Pol polyprotein LINE-1 [Senna tora]
MVWKNATDGRYNVKDGYNWILSNQSNHHSTSQPQYRYVWETIWRLRLPYRIIMFMWRALNENLPAYLVLVKHHMRCRNLKVMEGQHMDPIVAVNSIYASWKVYNFAFSNHISHNKRMFHPAKLQCWSTIDSLPTYGLLIITTVKKFRHTNLRTWRGLQIAFNSSTGKMEFNVIVFQKRLAKLIVNTYKNNMKYQDGPLCNFFCFNSIVL